MCVANARDRRGWRLHLFFWIRAEKSEGIGLGDFIPQLFKFNGPGVIPFGPKERDHFAERANPVPTIARTRDQRSDGFEKLFTVGLALNHELGKRFGGIERNVASRS